jgi:hypothetical protein
MGTNYYWHVKPCPTCAHPENKCHIGKSSYGWSFTFHALDASESPIGRPVVCANDWREVFKGEGKIVDEYGEEHTKEAFWAMVERKKDGLNHSKEMEKDCRYMSVSPNWCDDEGNSFSEGYFS